MATATATTTANNLWQLLTSTAEKHPNNGLLIYPPGQTTGEPRSIKYPDLLRRARENADKIGRLGLVADKIIVLHFDNHEDNFQWFWSIICAGHVPAMSTPFPSKDEQRLTHIQHLNKTLKSPLFLTTQNLRSEFDCCNSLSIQIVEDLPTIEYPESQNAGCHTDFGRFMLGNTLAVLMLTSGSTGHAKAVCLTHEQIIAAALGKGVATNSANNGSFLNWIGADHVACLTETHLHGMTFGTDQVHVEARDLVSEPLLFLSLINKHRIAHSFAPNFFLADLHRELAKHGPKISKFKDGLDLSCLKTIRTGGEANVVKTCVELTKLLDEHGASEHVLIPAYGLTETCGGVLFSKNCPQRDIERKNEFANVGTCIPGMDLRITDDFGNGLDGAVGNVEVRGNVVFQSYFNNARATAESFKNGWYATGDRGYIDEYGDLNLTGRSKETIIINGVNHYPHEIETELQSVPGVMPHFVVVFGYRLSGFDTEKMCVCYCPTFARGDAVAHATVNKAIEAVVFQTNQIKPYVLPLDPREFRLSTLGKISRTKIRASFEKGDYQTFQHLNDNLMEDNRLPSYDPPSTSLEKSIAKVVMEVLDDVKEIDLSLDSDLFKLGVSSIEIIRFRQKLEMKLSIEHIPTILIMTHSTIRSLAHALASEKESCSYKPMVVLQQGDGSAKTPLWLVHPGLGEILVFWPLASIMNRPVYGLRARGFEKHDQGYFTTIEEIVSTYHREIKLTQPEGPYAIAGYSYGSMIAYELAKRLGDGGDQVKFLGVLNLPPNIKKRMRELDWTFCLLHLAYFMKFFDEKFAHSWHKTLKDLPHEESLDLVFEKCPESVKTELGIDKEKLRIWADLSFALQNSAIDYEPAGMVESIDIFHAEPLKDAAKSVDEWKDQLSKWVEFSRSEPKFHHADGAHYTMISPENVVSFQKKLKAAITARGL